MSTYKPGQEWQKTLNENIFMKIRIQDLQAEVGQLERDIEALHQEIREMQNDAEFDVVDEEEFDVVDEEEYIQDARGTTWATTIDCRRCKQPKTFDIMTLDYRHSTDLVACSNTPSVDHDPSGNEY